MSADDHEQLNICTHCGEGVPKDRQEKDAEGHLFCCSGCDTVYHILKENNLDDFYKIRSRFDNKGAIKPSDQGDDFKYLDDPIFLKEEGYDKSLKMSFFLEGIHCAACLWLVEKLPDLVPGVTSSKVNMAMSTVDVTVLAGTKFSEVAQMLRVIGYPPHPLKSEDDLQKHLKKENRAWLIRLAISGAMTGNIMILSVSVYAGATGAWADNFNWLSFLLAFPVLTYGALPFYRSAWGALKVKHISIDVPIVFALIFGSSFSFVNMIRGSEYIYFDSLSALVFLLLSSRYLLKRLNEKALSSQRFLNILTPRSAKRVNPENLKLDLVSTESLREFDVVEVAQGGTLPTDGYLLSEEGRVDASLFSGESEPILIKRHQEVFGGYKNIGANALRFKVSKRSTQSRIGRVVSEINQHKHEETGSSALADKSARIFVALTLTMSVAIFLYFMNKDMQEGFERALSFVIIVCPCALALAVPLSFALSMGEALKRGIVIKTALSLEKLSKVRTIFFDKTGTLTSGEFTIEEIMTNSADLDEIYRIIYLLEKDSSHPIAKSLVKEITNRKPELKKIELTALKEYKEFLGHGPEGYDTDGSFLEIYSVDQGLDGDEMISVIGVFKNGEELAKIRLRDEVNERAEAVVSWLQQSKYIVKILSGDKKQNVQRIARLLNINNSNTYYEQKPNEKLQRVAEEDFAAMVGDGANDALSLKEAYVGIAVHGSLEVSFDASDVVLTRSGLKYISDVFQIAHNNKKVIKRNIIISICYNVIGGIMAVLGLVNPLVASVLMPLSSVTVLLSSVIGAKMSRVAKI